MTELLQDCARVLSEAKFSSSMSHLPGDGNLSVLTALVFEDATVLGFVLAYESAAELIAKWEADSARLAMHHREAFRTAQRKAWNAYMVLVARKPATVTQSLLLGQIEENLEAMRKIAKAGVTGEAGARAAPLPLLPLRAAPVLDPIDMPGEVKARTTELDPRLVAAFLSEADESVVVQLLEDPA